MKKKSATWDAANRLHTASLAMFAHDVVVAADLLSAASAKLNAAEKVFYRVQKKEWDRWEEEQEAKYGEVDWSNLSLIKRTTKRAHALTEAYERLQDLSIVQIGQAVEVRRVGQKLEQLLASQSRSAGSRDMRRRQRKKRSKKGA